MYLQQRFYSVNDDCHSLHFLQTMIFAHGS